MKRTSYANRVDPFGLKCLGISANRRALLLPVVFLLANSMALAGNLDRVVSFNIAPQSLQKALVQLAIQAHVQIVFASKISMGRLQTPAIRGKYPVRQALADLLRSSNYGFVEQGNTVEIVPNPWTGSDPRTGSGEEGAPIRNKMEPTRRGKDSKPASNPRQGKSGNVYQVSTLQQVVVTGTHIRGAPPEWAPVAIYTSDQIADAGYPTISAFMRSIPQNFSGVGADTVGLSQDSTSGNIGFGTDVDLRGLGFDSTLVLVNGHRMAPAGIFGAFTDISVLPLSDVQQVQIMTSGASAIYGSDAVGGVVNFILRTRQDGAVTSINYGGVTRGGLKDYRAAQSLGTSWQSGTALISYEFHDETPLSSSDRSFSDKPGVVSDLSPESRQNSVFGSLQQYFGAIRVTGDAFYADRHDRTFLVNLPTGEEADTDEFQGTLEAEWQIEGSWIATASASYGGNGTQARTQNTLFSNQYNATDRLASLELGATGAAAQLPAGPVKAAVGIQANDERLSQKFHGISSSQPAIDRSRGAFAVFGEADIPLIADNSVATRSVPSVLLHLAARYEHYSDFGASTNPEVGLAWRPLQSIRLRGTWGTSYSAPKLFELYGPTYAYLVNSPDPASASGNSAALVLGGSNSRLHAERSSQWTAGLDFSPEYVPGFGLYTTYYRIHYTDRIAPPPFPSLYDVLDAGDAFAPFISRNPPAAAIQAAGSPPNIFLNETIYPGLGPVETIGATAAIVNGTDQNLATTDTSGVDVRVDYKHKHRSLNYYLGANATYVLQYRDVTAAGFPALSIVNTLYNPLRFRARATSGVAVGPLGGNLALNYWSHYFNTIVPQQPTEIASWTTVDVQLRYRIPLSNSNGRSKVLDLALSCENCSNRDPPRVDNPFDFLHRGYDPDNANPLGRFVSLTATATW